MMMFMMDTPEDEKFTTETYYEKLNICNSKKNSKCPTIQLILEIPYILGICQRG